MKKLLFFLTFANMAFVKLASLSENVSRILQNEESIIFINIDICQSQGDCFKCNSFKDNINCEWKKDQCRVNNGITKYYLIIIVILLMTSLIYLILAFPMFHQEI